MTTDFTGLWTDGPRVLAGILSGAGFSVRIVGGAVRDSLLGKAPKDIDLVTDATPDEMLEIGHRLGLRTIPTLDEVQQNPNGHIKGGLKHGTVTFVIDGETYEVTTLRVDLKTDGRHAEVSFVRDFQLDASRRDFTFNAMSVDLNNKIYDYFGGREDLENCRVKFVGDATARMTEDYLRILRYFRFRTRIHSFGVLDAELAASITSCAPGLMRISGERIWSEMERILAVPSGVAQLDIMRRCGVTKAIGMPVDTASISTAQVAAQSGASAPAVLGSLLSDQNLVEDLRGRWKFSREEYLLASFVASNQSMASSSWSDFLGMVLEDQLRQDHVHQLLLSFGRTEEACKILESLPTFPLRGADLVAIGMSPGPDVGKSLSQLRRLWRDTGYQMDADALLDTVKEKNNFRPFC